MLEWYIVKVHLEREMKIAGLLKSKLPSDLYYPFVPQKEFYFRRAGNTKIERKICFPGFVFIESHTTTKDFLNAMKPLLWYVKEINSILSYDGEKDIALTESDIGVLKQLMDEDGCIEASRGDITDGVTRIHYGALAGKEHLIKKINRHKKSAEIEIKLMGEIQRITVALEIISKN